MTDEGIPLGIIDQLHFFFVDFLSLVFVMNARTGTTPHLDTDGCGRRIRASCKLLCIYIGRMSPLGWLSTTLRANHEVR